MEYKKFENVYVVRLDSGEEILESVKELSEKEGIKLAKIEAIGATNDFTVGAYSLKDKEYYKFDYKGAWEIVSLIGNITTMNGEFYAHLHMGAGDDKGNFVGGHLNRAVISVTCEMFVTVINGNVDRVKNEGIGINVFKFD